MSVAPTAETRTAMAAYDAATKLSLSELVEGVARGDAAAQIELGLRYATGRDVPTDFDRALKLFESAAKQGNPLGYYFIGTAFANGSGVPKDDSRAVFYWEHAAQQGYPNAQYWLGFFIANGRGGITPNWCAAVPLLAAAADHISDAAFTLGVAYQHGNIPGDDPEYADVKRAAYWYRKANAVQFNQKAQYNLRGLIETYLVDWQPGDPGKPPPPKPADWDKRRVLKPIVPDPSKDIIG